MTEASTSASSQASTPTHRVTSTVMDLNPPPDPSPMPPPRRQGSDPSTPLTKDEDAVRRYLVSILHASISAVNARNFDAKSPPWTLYAPCFRNETDGTPPLPLMLVDGLPRQSSLVGKKALTLCELLDFWREISTAWPEYHTRVVEMEACTLDLQEGMAEVVVHGESTGIPEGVVRASVSVVEFRRMSGVGGRWLCTRMRTMPGVDFGGGEVL